MNSKIGFAPFFSGGGMGLLMGILIGLSVSPVVGTVLGALTALLAAFLGLSEQWFEKKDEESLEIIERKHRVREVRTGSFGLACTIGVLCGLFIRVQDFFETPITTEFKKWESIGYTPIEIREILLYKELGLETKKFNSSVAMSNNNFPKGETSVLYSSTSEACKNMNPIMYSNIKEALNAWDLQGGQWQEASKKVKTNIPIESQSSVINLIWELLCNSEKQ